MEIVNLRSFAVDIAATGQHAPPGVPVDVDDDVAERLLEQVKVWGKPKPKTSKKTDNDNKDGDV